MVQVIFSIARTAARVAALLLGIALSGNAQIVETYHFGNLNRNIPDGNVAGLSDVETVNSAVANISSVRVKLHIAGEFNGDLYGYVRQANAVRTNFCVLINRPGRTANNPHGYSDAGLDVTFDAIALNGDIHNYQSFTVPAMNSPLTGIWKPDGRVTDPASVLDTDSPVASLDSFAGSATGMWTLFLSDVDSGGTNMLVDWEIDVTGSASPPPPVLEPIPDQIAYVLLPLVLTNHIVNSNLLTQPLTWNLGPGAPPDAQVDTNGVFQWTPGRDQARSTNIISVILSDSGSPPVLATNNFDVVVDDYVELALGRTALLVGHTSSVPVTLVSTVGLTNLQALVEIPGDHLAPLALSGLPPEVGSADLRQQASNLWQMNFTAAAGQAFQPTQQLASLSFLAVTNRSAFVPLVISEVTTNFTTNGVSVWRTLADDGRAVVIEREPLLEALPGTNEFPNLILYGIGGINYDILFNPTLRSPGWQTIWTGTMPPELSMPVTGLTNTGPTLFFRAQVNLGP